MAANYDFIMSYRKEFVYGNYTALCENPKPYDQITRKQMAKAIFSVYREEPTIFKNLLLTEEWEEVKQQVHKKKPDLLAIPGPAIHFYITERLPNIKVPEEISSLCDTLTLDDEKRKNDEIIRFLIGLVRIHGSMNLEDAYPIFHRFFPEYDYKTFVELPRRLPRVFTDIVAFDYVYDDVLRYEDCHVDSNSSGDDHPRRTYTLAE